MAPEKRNTLRKLRSELRLIKQEIPFARERESKAMRSLESAVTETGDLIDRFLKIEEKIKKLTNGDET